MTVWIALALFLPSEFCLAQIRITFLPPPLEGTLSLGIYDKAGKLVRALRTEATEKDFTVGLNGFITTWDGKDDTGQPLPAGKYSARGFAVGEVEVEGVAFHCNDWITDADSPRIRAVLEVHPRGDGFAIFTASGPPSEWRRSAGDAESFTTKIFLCSGDGKVLEEIAPQDIEDRQAVGGAAEDAVIVDAVANATAREQVVVQNGKVVVAVGRQRETLPLPDVGRAISACFSREGGVWVIDMPQSGAEVTEYSRQGEIRRKLAIPPTEPQPQRIFAAKDREQVYLIERGAAMERLRSLALRETGTAAETRISTWEIVFSKAIHVSDTFAQVAPTLGRAEPPKPLEKFSAKLINNPLLDDEPGSVDLVVGHDGKGAVLKTADGLPLVRLTETPHLKWTAMTREGSGKLITFFQGDGAVVEEFRISKLANMMAFDAGEYEWTDGQKNSRETR